LLLIWRYGRGGRRGEVGLGRAQTVRARGSGGKDERELGGVEDGEGERFLKGFDLGELR